MTNEEKITEIERAFTDYYFDNIPAFEEKYSAERVTIEDDGEVSVTHLPAYSNMMAGYDPLMNKFCANEQSMGLPFRGTNL